MIVVGIPKEDLEHSSQHCSLPVSLCAGRLRAVRGLLILTSMVANVDIKLLFAEYNGVPQREEIGSAARPLAR